jgi:cation:H+ antiporter
VAEFFCDVKGFKMADTLIIDFLMIAGGLVFLYLGGEGLLKGSISLAIKFGLSKFIVSAIIIGFGTSLPELTVSVGAALKGSSDIALGNVVGSNIANIILILSIGILIFPLAMKVNAVKRDALVMVGASALLCVMAVTGTFTFILGAILFSALIAYIGVSYVMDKKQTASANQTEPSEEETAQILSPLLMTVYILFGLLFLVIGAKLMVDGSISLARDFGISEAIIGLTVVAVGTSLPELAATIVSAIKKQADMIIGNILGSNIFNILGILGITAMIKPISVDAHMLNFDVWFMLGVAIFLAALLWAKRPLLGRMTGSVMLLAYMTYVGFLYMGTPA